MNSYFTLRSLTGPTDKALGATFERMAELLAGVDEAARLQFQILSDDQPLYWLLDISPKTCQARAEKTDKPDFEVITRVETWREIAEGKLAPLRAFVQGRMRVRGDIELGKRLLKRLASSQQAEDEGRQ